MLSLLVRFGQRLRDAGMAVGTGDVLTFTAALARLDPASGEDLYWAGRTTLVIRREDIAVYDRVFREFFLDCTEPPREFMKLKPAADGADTVFDVPETQPGAERQEAGLGLLASTVEVLRAKHLADCTDQELALLRRIRLSAPNRRTHRTESARSGLLDTRRTIRAAMRTGGDPAALLRKQRRIRARPVVLILDVSGSMADYSRALLQFAYATKRSMDKVEVFCFGTRLARVTRQLRHRNPDAALARATERVTDWDGGTRIGRSLDTFVREWGRVCRGAAVVVCSDGLDRGDPELLAKAMERLSRLCHRVVWISPHRTNGPRSMGMMIAAPHIDILLTAPDLHELAAAMGVVSGLPVRAGQSG